jgi:hypothetical protein
VRFLNVGGYALYERSAIQQEGDHETTIIDGVNRLALGDSSEPFSRVAGLVRRHLLGRGAAVRRAGDRRELGPAGAA